MMKKLFLFLTMFLTLAAGMAQTNHLPAFSTEGVDTTWYNVQFAQSGYNLVSRGVNMRVRTAAASPSANGQKWALFGTHDDFRLVSADGRSLKFSDTENAFVCCAPADGISFELAASVGGDEYFEVRRKGGTTSLLPQRPQGISSAVYDSLSGTFGHAIEFIATETSIYSTANKERWYFIQFAAGAMTVIEDKGNGQNVKQAELAVSNEAQLWKLMGNDNGFTIQNKKNNTYLYVDGGYVKSTSNASSAGTFTLTSSGNSSYSSAKMIGSGTAGYFNAWQGITSGNNVGIWSSTSDQNNAIQFVTVDGYEAADYTVSSLTGYTPAQVSTLWYTTPSTLASTLSGDRWKDYALPLGNGQFGTTFLGGVYKEDLQFNEKTLWTGRSSDKATSGSTYSAGNGGYGGYQNFGHIYVKQMDTETFDFESAKKATDYLRELDLSTATGHVTFKNADKSVTYERRYIVSNPDNVGAYLFTANAPGKQTLRIYMESGKPGVNAKAMFSEDGTATFSGSLETVSYRATMKVVAKGGTLIPRLGYIDVKDADSVIIYLAGGTDYDASSTTYVSAALKAGLESEMLSRVEAAAAKGWDAIYADHVADHQQFFNRVDFTLDAARNNKPTNELVDAYSTYKGTTNAGALMLEKLYFDYGRYMTIAGSRGIDLPTNLQGIWNNSSNAPWGADIHANINVQMNYWPAEPTNLSELHMPLLNYIVRMSNSKQWKDNATIMAGQKYGWTCITENNIFGGRGSFMTNYVIANAWYVTHLWQHYRYTLDKDYLARVFPTMWSATQFWLDRLILASDGTYECPNEYSPEHGPGSENGVAHAQQLVWELFDNTQKAIEILGAENCGVSSDWLTIFNDRFSKLDKGLAIETYTGTWGSSVNGITTGTSILREWKYSDYTAGANGHRHCSHLMCLYPFSQVTYGSPEFNAAVNSLQLRGDASTGWSMAWKINLWARAKNGAHAHQIFDYALVKGTGSGGVLYNLFDVHAPYYFQIDGNYGACAGMAEMLMQSHSDTIEVLPALPTALWKNGHIHGLKAIGDFTVDIDWANAAATKVIIESNQGQPLFVKLKNIGKRTDVNFYIGSTKVEVTRISDDIVQIPAAAGDVAAIYIGSEMPTAIGKAQTAADVCIKVNGRTVSAEGDVVRLVVTDVQGRRVKDSRKSSVSLPEHAGRAFVVTATNRNGATTTRKVIL